jgi:hypothetical protein
VPSQSKRPRRRTPVGSSMANAETSGLPSERSRIASRCDESLSAIADGRVLVGQQEHPAAFADLGLLAFQAFVALGDLTLSASYSWTTSSEPTPSTRACAAEPKSKTFL